MALAKSKTWKTVDCNTHAAELSAPPDQTVAGCTYNADRSNTVRLMLWRIKEALVAAPGSWTVLSSCGHNGAAFVYGAADYWTSASWLWWVYNTEYSWIVLRNTAVWAGAQGFQLCIACWNSRGNQAGCYPHEILWAVSPSAGFTGGSTTARPTATDEIVIKDGVGGGAYWTETTTSTACARGATVFKTDDGTCTRIYTYGGRRVLYLFAFEKFINLHAGQPDFLIIPGIAPVYSNLVASASYPMTVYWNGAATGVCFSTVGYGGGSLSQYVRYTVPDYWGRYVCSRLGITVGQNRYYPGFLGFVSDLWTVPTGLADGQYYPDATDRGYVVLGDLLQPNEAGALVNVK